MRSTPPRSGDDPAAGRPEGTRADDRLGESIRRRRLELGLRLVDVAERVGVSASAVSQIERGLIRPSMQTLVRVSGALDVMPHHLLEGRWHGGPSEPVPTRVSRSSAVVTRAADAQPVDDGDREGSYRVMAVAPGHLAAYEFHGGPAVWGSYFSMPSDHLNIVAVGSYQLQEKGCDPIALAAGDTCLVGADTFFRWLCLDPGSRLLSIVMDGSTDRPAAGAAPWRSAAIRELPEG